MNLLNHLGLSLNGSKRILKRWDKGVILEIRRVGCKNKDQVLKETLLDDDNIIINDRD